MKYTREILDELRRRAAINDLTPAEAEEIIADALAMIDAIAADDPEFGLMLVKSIERMVDARRN
jgi:creatinine amidohydrolase/Fe(II)-dependent formamide hydrolase-like protein